MAQIKSAHKTARGAGKWQGQKWIRNEKRLAIYLRDGLACCYCGASVEEGTQLTLDHVQPHSHGGTNDASNLVTCCKKCNSSRGNRELEAFVTAVAGYINHGIDASDILAHIATTTRRPLDVPAAKALIALRGGFSQAVKN